MSRIDWKVEWTLFAYWLTFHACTYKTLWSYNFLRPKKVKNLICVFLLNPDKDWLYVLTMSRTHFRVNPYSVVAWMSRNSLLLQKHQIDFILYFSIRVVMGRESQLWKRNCKTKKHFCNWFQIQNNDFKSQVGEGWKNTEI